MSVDVKGLAHIGLFVSDIEKSKKFYTELLGFEIACESTNTMDDGKTAYICFVKKGSMMVELLQVPGVSYGDGKFQHVAMEVDDIEAAVADLKAKGVKFNGEIVNNPALFNGLKFITFEGSDGEVLEFNQYL